MGRRLPPVALARRQASILPPRRGESAAQVAIRSPAEMETLFRFTDTRRMKRIQLEVERVERHGG